MILIITTNAFAGCGGAASQPQKESEAQAQVQIETDADDESTVEVNHSLAAGYMKAVDELCAKYGLERGNSVELLTSHPDIFSVRKTPADEETDRRSTPGSVAFVPAVAGLVLAGEVIKDLIKE